MARWVVAWAAVALACTAVPTVAQIPSAKRADKEYPVTRVVELLKDMQVQLEKEQDADEEIYSKMACWCETNDKAKTKAIADAEARLANLDNTIEKMSALSATLGGEIEGLKKEIAKNVKSLEVATALREKQLAEFNAEEKEMIQTIAAVKNAVVVLSKHHEGGSAFLDNKVVMNALATAKALAEKHTVLLQGVITPSQKRVMSALAKDKQPTYAAYKPQSGQIFGILKQMQETFESDLSTAQKEEMAAAAAYKELKEAKEKEIAAGEESLAGKEEQKAITDQTKAQAEQDKEDTEASLSADQKFLMALKEKCAMSDKEWDERQKERAVELEAVAKAISILHSDDSRDLFSRTFNAASFLQVKSESDKRRENAAKLLAKFPKLATLATSVRLDEFTEVKKAIDKMITALQEEGAEEIKHKDFCTEGLFENEKDTQEKTHTKEGLESKIAGLEQTIKEQTAQIKTLTAEIEDLQVQIKRAGEDREVERKEFEGTVADQRETQAVLKQALDVLKEVYGDGVVFAQVKSGQEPPEGFSDYKKQTGSTGVIMLINQIIADAKEMEAVAMHDEEQAQKAYEGFVKDTNDSIQAKGDAKTDLEGQKADAETDLTAAKSELDGTLTDLSNLADGAAALHKSCDYTLKNFDVRQEARDQEIDALRKAKAFLSGMKE